MDKQSLQHLRHSTAHLLAAAILEWDPVAKRGIGPATDNGFYYDFDLSRPITEEDFPLIEELMAKILKTWTSVEREEVSEDDAKKRFQLHNEKYKLELIEEFANGGEELTIYRNGTYEDLCKGGHVENPRKEIGAFKLLSIAGAY